MQPVALFFIKKGYNSLKTFIIKQKIDSIKIVKL